MLPAVDPLLTRLHQLDEVLVQDISVAVTETFSFISYLKGEGGRRGEVGGGERSAEGGVENRRVEKGGWRGEGEGEGAVEEEGVGTYTVPAYVSVLEGVDSPCLHSG